MRTLVTGASGFVGGALLERLAARGGDNLYALSRTRPRHETGVHWRSVDLASRADVVRFVAEVRPERVFHLAALAHPGDCAADPARAFAVQVGGTAALLAALPRTARVLVASTSQVYGVPASSPVPEEAPLLARSAYGRSKRAAEAVAAHFARTGDAVVVARPFNHSGAGQSARYVVPALAASVRAARAAGTTVATGNLFPRRDFLHVDDVLDAYELLIERGNPGSAYNVARGEGVAIGEILAEIQRQLGSELEPTLDPERARPDDPPEIVGDPARLFALGWRPRRDLQALVADVLAAR